MKLAILLMDYPVVSETFVARDIKTFLKNKCKVSVFTLRNKRGESQNSQGENFELNPTRENVNSLIEAVAAIYRILFWAIFVIFSEKKVIEKLKLIYLVPRAHQITEHLLVNKYDIIHLYWGHYPSLVGLMLKRRDKKQSVSLFLGAYDMEKNLEISKKMTMDANFLWTHAPGNIARLKHLGFPTPRKFKVNYRGLELTEDWGQRKIWKHREITFLTVSRLVEGKGIEECLEVMLELKRNNKPYKYLLVGDGPLKKYCLDFVERNDLSDCVHITGSKPIKTVFEYMNNSKYFLLLSEKLGECLPNVIKEAMMHGCYVLSAKSMNIDELIVSPKVGITVEKENLDECFKIVCRFIDEDIIPDLSVQKSVLSEKFDINKSIQTYLVRWNG